MRVLVVDGRVCVRTVEASKLEQDLAWDFPNTVQGGATDLRSCWTSQDFCHGLVRVATSS